MIRLTKVLALPVLLVCGLSGFLCLPAAGDIVHRSLAARAGEKQLRIPSSPFALSEGFLRRSVLPSVGAAALPSLKFRKDGRFVKL